MERRTSTPEPSGSDATLAVIALFVLAGSLIGFFAQEPTGGGLFFTNDRLPWMSSAAASGTIALVHTVKVLLDRFDRR